MVIASMCLLIDRNISNFFVIIYLNGFNKNIFKKFTFIEISHSFGQLKAKTTIDQMNNKQK